MGEGELFLSAVVQILIDQLALLELLNFARREGLGKKKDRWSKTLKRIKAVLDDADEKQNADRAVKDWPGDLRDLAYDVEDLLDEFITEALRWRLTGGNEATTRYDGLHEVPQVHLSSCPSPSLGQEPNQSSLPPGNGEQGSNSSISSQGVILVLIGSVIGLLQLNDLFETHPANMWISEAALIIFCMSYATMTKINGTRWARHSQIIDRFRILSGTLVAVSLLSIHLPHQLSWLFYVIWAFLAFIVACTWIYPEGEGREVETSISLVPV